MPLIMISALAVAVVAGLLYCHFKGWNNRCKATDRDEFRIWFLKNRYIPNLESKKAQGIITEEEYQKELTTIEEEVKEMEERLGC